MRQVTNIAKGLEERFDRRFGELRADVKEWAAEQHRDLKELHAKIVADPNEALALRGAIVRYV